MRHNFEFKYREIMKKIYVNDSDKQFHESNLMLVMEVCEKSCKSDTMTKKIKS